MSKLIKVLLVDDQALVLQTLSLGLGPFADVDVIAAVN